MQYKYGFYIGVMWLAYYLYIFKFYLAQKSNNERFFSQLKQLLTIYIVQTHFRQNFSEACYR